MRFFTPTTSEKTRSLFLFSLLPPPLLPAACRRRHSGPPPPPRCCLSSRQQRQPSALTPRASTVLVTALSSRGHRLERAARASLRPFAPLQQRGRRALTTCCNGPQRRRDWKASLARLCEKGRRVVMKSRNQSRDQSRPFCSLARSVSELSVNESIATLAT